MDEGRTWSKPVLMGARAGDPPPHSVMPQLVALSEGHGYLLSGGRSGLYVWFCADEACIDADGWQATNLAAHHNAAVGLHDHYGKFSDACVNTSLWNTRHCNSKGYIGLVELQKEPEPGAFLACYGACFVKPPPCRNTLYLTSD